MGALRLGRLDRLRLSELLGTRDTVVADSRAWPAVCGPPACRAEYEKLFRAVQRMAASCRKSLLQVCVADGLTCVSEGLQVFFSDGVEQQASTKRRRFAAALLLGPAWSASTGGAQQVSASTVPLGEFLSSDVKKALKLADDGQFKEAEKVFAAIISTSANRGSAQLDLGLCKEASAKLTQATALAPDAPILYTSRAAALLCMFDASPAQSLLTSARIDCLSAVRIDPADATAYYVLGEVWWRDALNSNAFSFEQVKWRQAADAFREASEAAPGIAVYNLKRAMALFEAGDKADANHMLASLVSMSPAYVEANVALAAVASSIQQQDAAETAFARAFRYAKAGDQNAMRMPSKYADARGWPPKLATAFESLSTQQKDKQRHA